MKTEHCITAILKHYTYSTQSMYTYSTQSPLHQNIHSLTHHIIWNFPL